MKLFLTAIIVILTGCASTAPPIAETRVDPSLLQPCPTLEKLEGTDGKTIMKWSLEVVNSYKLCRTKHKRLSEAVKVTQEKAK